MARGGGGGGWNAREQQNNLKNGRKLPTPVRCSLGLLRQIMAHTLVAHRGSSVSQLVCRSVPVPVGAHYAAGPQNVKEGRRAITTLLVGNLHLVPWLCSLAITPPPTPPMWPIRPALLMSTFTFPNSTSFIPYCQSSPHPNSPPPHFPSTPHPPFTSPLPLGVGV